MTAYDDGLLAAQFAALAPEPLEGRWDDVLREATAARDDGRRVKRSAATQGGRRYLVAFVAAVLVAAIGTAAYGTVRVLILDQGFIGLPPVGATPSSPESSDLVVEWFGFARRLPPQQDRRDMVRAWVYADGRIIWDRRPHDPEARRISEGANDVNSGYLEQRLTSDGVELVRTAAAELLERSRAQVEEIPAEEDPWWGDHHPRLALVVPDHYVSAWGLLAVPDGDRSARLLWIGNDDSIFDGTPATPEQLSAIRRVYALLTDPASVLPSNAWAVQKARAYVPSHYAVCVDTSPPKEVSQVLSMLPTRAAALLRDKSPTRSKGELVEGREGGQTVVIGRSGRDCFKLETEEAREVADALSGLEREPGWDRFAPAYRVAEPVNHLNPTWIWFEPYFPDGRIPFSGPFG